MCKHYRCPGCGDGLQHGNDIDLQVDEVTYEAMRLLNHASRDGWRSIPPEVFARAPELEQKVAQLKRRIEHATWLVGLLDQIYDEGRQIDLAAHKRPK